MYDVMDGIKVIEVAEHTFVPAASMVLADWGADVIKIERTTAGGDPGRNLPIPNSSKDGISMYFEAGNRGKRSVALNLHSPEGRELLAKLVASADVFITNLRADARRKLKIEPADMMAINPKLIYARGTGYGLRGDMANDGGFDMPSSWCRSGSAYLQTLPGMEPVAQPGSIGDLGGGLTLCGAISAALFRRERTGKGAIVDNSLYAFGIYLMSQSVIGASMGLQRGPQQPRSESFAPLINFYRTKDDRWLFFCYLNDSWWPDLCRHLDRPDWIEDPRFATAQNRFENRKALIAGLDEIFALQTYDYWRDKLKSLEGVWSPLHSPEEVVADPQAIVNSFVAPVRTKDGAQYLGGVSPAQFDEQPIGELRAAPGYGEHNVAVLQELGYSDAEIAAFRDSGVIT